MSDFLGRIAQRALGVAVVAQPAIAPRFAPGPSLSTEHLEQSLEIKARPARILATAPPQIPVEPRAASDVQPTQAAPETLARDMQPEARPEARSVRTQRSIAAAPLPTESPKLPSGGSEPDAKPAPAPAASLSDLEPEQISRKAEEPVPAIEPQVAVKLATDSEPTRQIEIKPDPIVQPILWREPQAPLSARRGGLSEKAEQSDSIVRVNIGRVEVRAVFPDPPRQSVPARRPSRPTLSLSEYLKQRDGGQR